LRPAESRYSTFDRELLAAYLAIKHFRHFIEGHSFTLYTDHKPLTFALFSNPNHTPRQAHQLSYISEFTSNVCHLPGKSNAVADALSCNPPHIGIVSTIEHPNFDYKQLAAAQADDPDLMAGIVTETGLEVHELEFLNAKLLCDVSTGRPRPLVPTLWRHKIFETLHNLSHAGIRATHHLVSSRFVWPRLNADIASWVRSCVHSQRAKVQRHTKSPYMSLIIQGGDLNISMLIFYDLSLIHQGFIIYLQLWTGSPVGQKQYPFQMPLRLLVAELCCIGFHILEFPYTSPLTAVVSLSPAYGKLSANYWAPTLFAQPHSTLKVME